MKKIAFIVYDFSKNGGVNQVVTTLSNSFIEDYEIHLISIIQENNINYKLDKRIKYKSFFDSENRLRKLYLKLKKPLKEYIIQNNIENVILEGDYAGFLGTSLRFTTKAKIFFHEHGSLMSQWDKKSIVFIRFLSSLFSHKTIVLTKRNKEAYIKKFFKKEKNLCVIPNWVNIKMENTKNYNVNSKKIIYAGRFEYEKGVLNLLSAWKSIYKNIEGWRLDLYGDGEEMDKVKNFISKNNLSETVNLMGWQKNLDNKFNDYAFLILPSEREGFPLIILEAQSHGLPVISYDILTGPSEIINNQIDGILINERNYILLGKEIEKLANDKEKRIIMSKNAKENINRFSKENIINYWKKII